MCQARVTAARLQGLVLIVLTVPVTRLPVKARPGWVVKAPLLSSGNQGAEEEEEVGGHGK